MRRWVCAAAVLVLGAGVALGNAGAGLAAPHAAPPSPHANHTLAHVGRPAAAPGDASARLGARRSTPEITSPDWPYGLIPPAHYANHSPAAAAAIARRAPEVLRVGTFHGIPGQFATIQAAVDAARPGAVILVAPGDYKTHSVRFPTGSHHKFPAAVLITTPNLTLRGMNRNTTIVDDTSVGPACNSVAADQSFGPGTPQGPAGLNGIMVWKAPDVSVENLTTCNFPGGSGLDGDTGNGVWWNGGANSGSIGGWGFYGAWLTATTQFFQNETSAAQYGLFTSNWDGGMLEHVYASNMNDSGIYIGACQQQCNQVLNDAWSEFSALGYSGTNSGGSLVIENSQWDNNEDGFDTNSQNADEPSPQNGACPDNGISPITHTHSCWVFMHNWSHDNNDTTAPAAGSAAAGPVGTGMTLSGGRNDTVMDNLFENNNAWGTAFVPYPDSGPPCTGGRGGQSAGASCVFDEWGDALLNNLYRHNGGYGNPTNGDFGFTNLLAEEPTDCFAGNRDLTGPFTSTPANLERQFPRCTGQRVALPQVATPGGALFATEIICDSGVGLVAGASAPCPPGSSYPAITTPVMHQLPPASELPSMPRPCADVPANPWCSGSTVQVAGCAGPRVSLSLALATGERLRSVRVTVNGHRIRVRRRGARISLSLGARPRESVRVSEVLSVRGHRETVTSTHVYRRC